METCVYLDQDSINHPAQVCYRYGKCRQVTPEDSKLPAMGIPTCDRCKEKLLLNDPLLINKFRDPLKIIDKEETRVTCLEGMLKGHSIAFLVCGGPSAKDLPMEHLNRRGCWSLAVNNAAGWTAFHPQAFVHSDPPSKFHHGIWTDPTVMKFVPAPKLKRKRGKLRKKVGDEFVPLMKPDGEQMATCDCPNIWGFLRRSWLVPDSTFFTDAGAGWGNLNVGVKRTGEEKTVCTMLLGLRILYHLGARTIFLVGVDFRMDPSRSLTDNYSFGENRNTDACNSNNSQYKVVNGWLCRMAENGTFSRFGLNIYNCFQNSGLRAFPHVPFSQAVGMATAGMEEPFDLNGWYYKAPRAPRNRRG